MSILDLFYRCYEGSRLMERGKSERRDVRRGVNFRLARTFVVATVAYAVLVIVLRLLGLY
jgi:hypothetical protein